MNIKIESSLPKCELNYASANDFFIWEGEVFCVVSPHASMEVISIKDYIWVVRVKDSQITLFSTNTMVEPIHSTNVILTIKRG